MCGRQLLISFAIIEFAHYSIEYIYKAIKASLYNILQQQHHTQ